MPAAETRWYLRNRCFAWWITKVRSQYAVDLSKLVESGGGLKGCSDWTVTFLPSDDASTMLIEPLQAPRGSSKLRFLMNKATRRATRLLPLPGCAILG